MIRSSSVKSPNLNLNPNLNPNLTPTPNLNLFLIRVHPCSSVVAFLLFFLALPLIAADAKIHKVLPHFVDKEGRHTLSPSLYERDAYQAQLRNNPQQRRGLRFDVHWKARKSDALKLRVDMRGSLTNEATNVSVELPVKPPGFFSKWSAVHVRGPDYARLGGAPRCWTATRCSLSSARFSGNHERAAQRCTLNVGPVQCQAHPLSPGS